MVFTAIFTLIYSFVFLITAPLRLLSDVSVDSGIGSAIFQLAQYVRNTAGVIPFSTLTNCVIIILTLEGFIFSFKMIMRIAKFFPGVK
jgi:hypothetical protein